MIILKDWTSWFAWYPIQVKTLHTTPNGTTATYETHWLTHVERQLVSQGYRDPYYQYRLIK